MLPWFERAVERARAAGVREILLDPGLGYAQRGVAQESRDRMQRHVFSQLERLRALGLPLFAAVMRKQSRTATLELVRMMVAGGIDFLRAHEPEVVFDAMSRAPSPSRAPASLRDA